MKKALVTGGCGFVGSAMVRRLLRDGWSVRVLGRSGQPSDVLYGLDIEYQQGDIINTDDCRRALRECSALFHFAADYRLWVPQPQSMYRTNVDASRELVRLAAEAGCERIVYCSSVATLGCFRDGRIADESTPVSLGDMIEHYKRSKFLAEQAVLGLVRDKGVPVVVVNPSTPVGPRDAKPTPTGKMILDAYCGRVPAFLDTGLNVVHVDDVADGALRAFRHGRTGERYVLGGENMLLRKLLELVCSFSGRPPPRLALPNKPLYPLALAMESVARLTGKEPLIHRDVLRMACKKMFFSSAKASNELGYTARSAEQAVAAAVHWYYDNDYCCNSAVAPRESRGRSMAVAENFNTHG